MDASEPVKGSSGPSVSLSTQRTEKAPEDSGAFFIVCERLQPRIVGRTHSLVERPLMLIVTPQQMDMIDAETIHESGLSSLVLMENAARSVLPHLPDRGSVTVLVGPGNNGGDGLVLARALKEQGREVEAVCFSRKLSKDAQVQKGLAKTWNVPLPEWLETTVPDEYSRHLEGNRVIVDALFGTGLSRPLEGHYAQAIDFFNRSTGRRLAIDIPSGLDGKTGQVLGIGFKAHKTVSFGLAKWGHSLYPGRQYCGELIVTQPGFVPEALSRFPAVSRMTPEVAATLLPSPWPTMHKGDNGRLLLLTGSTRYPGAGILSTLGALRGGAGLVTLAATSELRNQAMHWTPEALLADRTAIEDLDSFNAGVVGCGLGNDAETFGRDLMESFPQPLVVDADALPLTRHFALPKKQNWILTPHPGELARLLDCSVRDLERDRISSALDASKELGAVLCFKGAPTICASPDGRAYVNTTGNSVLAQGGSGDVLAGLIGAYLSFGLPLLEAAAAAVFVHGRAADILASEGRGRGAPAHQLAERIPASYTASSKAV